MQLGLPVKSEGFQSPTYYDIAILRNQRNEFSSEVPGVIRMVNAAGAKLAAGIEGLPRASKKCFAKTQT